MGTIETTSLEQYDRFHQSTSMAYNYYFRVMATNVRAVLHLTMLAVPHLEKTEGNVVNVSSVNGIRSFPG